MIQSFGSRKTEKIWNGDRILRLSREVEHVARRKLRMINNSHSLEDLRIPPSNRLEKLKGDLKGYYSVRINDQWRIIFVWKGNHAYDVEIIDYH